MSTSNESTKTLGIEEVQTRRRVRCLACELAIAKLVQWATRPSCRRCGVGLSQPIINLVEVEKPVPVIQKEILEVPVIREITVPIDRPSFGDVTNSAVEIYRPTQKSEAQ